MIITTPLEEDCFYHIYSRGNNGEDIFIDNENYIYFLNLIKKYIIPVADVYAYCLMRNHFHLLIKIKDNKAKQSFSNFFNAYAKAFNKKYKRTGKLFEERFKRKKCDNDFYFTELIYYIHLNPQKHKIVNDFKSYKYSSFETLLSLKTTSLKRQEVLEWFGGRELFEKYHLEMKNYLNDNRFEDNSI